MSYLYRGLSFSRELFYYTPAAIVVGVWLIYMVLADRFFIFDHYWALSATMSFGSFIAGATSEGGGAVAFPVFTKLFHIPPDVARTFALAIQTVGMGTAALTIAKQRIPVARSAVLYSSLGGFVGITLGTFLVAPVMPPAYSKILFTVLAFGFGVMLFSDNRGGSIARATRPVGSRQLIIGALLLAGLVGGTYTSIVGTGIDIVTFSFLVLLFNVSEKVATPTSVVLMAINSAIGLFYQVAFTGGFDRLVMDYWLCCIPVVIIGAPLGAILCAQVRRSAVVKLLLTLIVIEFVSTLILVPFDLAALIVTPIWLAGTILFFRFLTRVRDRTVAARSG